jgi:hypothetical protein
VQQVNIDTPFGKPSDAITIGTLDGLPKGVSILTCCTSVNPSISSSPVPPMTAILALGEFGM